MKVQRGRKPVNILTNPLYSTLLFCIASHHNYPKKIADLLNKNLGNTAKQLDFLEDKGFIISKLEGNPKVFPFEKKILSVNWEKINQEFISFVQSEVNRWIKQIKDSGIDTDSKDLNNEIFSKRMLGLAAALSFQKEKAESFRKNRYLTSSFQQYF